MYSAPEPADELDRLEEAAAIWRDLRSPLGEARVALLEALLSATPTPRATRRSGCRARLPRVSRRLSSLLPRDTGLPLVVQALGRFRVLRGGEPIPLTAWQSRKARDLLKILVARRGRPTPRDFLMEALWPEQDPGKLGNRLSVLLSTVRTVLDPGKRFDADHFIAADRSSLWIQSENLAVDVECFLDAASAALAALRDGSPDAGASLAAAEATYSGDFLEEDAYEDWAVALREEARAAYTEVARALAEDASARETPMPRRGTTCVCSSGTCRRACAPRPGHRARRGRTSRRGASTLPCVLRAHGVDRDRIGLVPCSHRGCALLRSTP